MGFDPTTGILYGLCNLPGVDGDRLFTIDTTTGAASIIGPIVGDDPSGLAFDNAGNLWIVDSNVNGTDIVTLRQINKAIRRDHQQPIDRP